nr:MAG TPA: hypothetical protein [Crassvirales sp.]
MDNQMTRLSSRVQVPYIYSMVLIKIALNNNY